MLPQETVKPQKPSLSQNGGRGASQHSPPVAASQDDGQGLVPRMHCRRRKSPGAARERAADSGPGITTVTTTPLRGGDQGGQRHRTQITVEIPRVWAEGEKDRESVDRPQASDRGDKRGRFRRKKTATREDHLNTVRESRTEEPRGPLRGSATMFGVLQLGKVLIVPVEKSTWIRLLGLHPPESPKQERSVSVRRPRGDRAKQRREDGEKGGGSGGGAREAPPRGVGKDGEAESQAPPRRALTQTRLDISRGSPLRDWLKAKNRLARQARAEERRKRRAEKEEGRRREREREERARESERRVRAWMERKRKEAAESHRRLYTGAGDFLSPDPHVPLPALQVDQKKSPVSRRRRNQRQEGRSLQMCSHEETRNHPEEKNPRSSPGLDYLVMSTSPSEHTRANEEPVSPPNMKSRAASGSKSTLLKDYPKPKSKNALKQPGSSQQRALACQTNKSNVHGHHKLTHGEWLRGKTREERRIEQAKVRRSELDPELKEMLLKRAMRRLEDKLKSRGKVDSGRSASLNPMTQPSRKPVVKTAPAPKQLCPGNQYQHALGSLSSEHKSSNGHVAS